MNNVWAETPSSPTQPPSCIAGHERPVPPHDPSAPGQCESLTFNQRRRPLLLTLRCYSFMDGLRQLPMRASSS